MRVPAGGARTLEQAEDDGTYTSKDNFFKEEHICC